MPLIQNCILGQYRLGFINRFWIISISLHYPRNNTRDIWYWKRYRVLAPIMTNRIQLPARHSWRSWLIHVGQPMSPTSLNYLPCLGVWSLSQPDLKFSSYRKWDFPPSSSCPHFCQICLISLQLITPSEIERLYLIDPPLSGCDMKTHFNLPCFSALIFRSLTVPTFIPFRAERYEEKHRIQIQPYLVAIIYSKIPISRC